MTLDCYKEMLEDQRKYFEIERNGKKPDPKDGSQENMVEYFVQTHTHEFESSTKLAEEGNDRHNHRFAGVTSELIPLSCRSHKHAVFTLTDYFGHLHEVAAETGPAVDVGNGKHVHFVQGFTTLDDGHFHEFGFTTQIDSPLLPPADGR